MGKKLNLLLTGMLIGEIWIGKEIIAPTKSINYFQPTNLNEIVKEVQFRDFKKELEEKQKILNEEQKLLKKDKIYIIIDSYYKKLDVPEYISKKFVRTLINVESKDNPEAVSEIGARGLGQLMKKAWYEVEKENYWKNSFIPEKNINVTIKYLAWIDKTCEILHPNWKNLSKKEKLNLISAAYNGGIGKLKEVGWNIDKMPRETREYIPKLEKIARKFIPSEEIY